jgi:DNA polymerase III delta prime subunit
MTAGAVQSWLTLLEKLPNKCVVLFTTTESWKGEKALFGSFDHPLQSRATVISLTNQGLAEAFAKRAQEIAEKENLGGAEPREYLALVRACKNNMRAVLSQIEGFELHREVAGNVAA